jgi:RND family efflux transporter MFP subunit
MDMKAEATTSAPRNHDDSELVLPSPARVSRATGVTAAVAAVVVLAGAFAAGYLPRRQARAAVDERALAAAGERPRVEVLTPKAGASTRAMQLPATVTPLQETVVFSRANGYVRRWLFDIGDNVKDGELLAELDTPELDQQLEQGRAQLVQAQAAVLQAKANGEFSKITYDRYKPLTAQGLTSPQDLDQRRSAAAVDEANIRVAEANVAAQNANVLRLVQMKGFARVTAPFAGKITARMIEIGALVTAGNASPLFKLATLDPMRVFVEVPQDIAPSVQPGQTASIAVREYPARAFTGTITRSAGELDPVTRTMNTEVRVPNRDGALIPGMYAQMSLTLPYAHHVFEVPATAVINDANGMRVAVVGADDTVHLIPIEVERDTGSSFEISRGLTGTERVVKLAGGNVTEGLKVAVLKSDSLASAAK